MKLTIGEQAPLFSLPDQNDTVHNLADYKGKRVLLYFYPKDDTEGCTKQACAIEAALPDFKKLTVTVLGISVDPIKSHAKFAEKYGLSFTLLSDKNKEVVEKYDVWGMKKFMGREYMGTMRTSFLIGAEGVIEKIYENVKPEIHAAEVLADLDIK
jgi:peroxiredoxin Q/BCP